MRESLWSSWGKRSRLMQAINVYLVCLVCCVWCRQYMINLFIFYSFLLLFCFVWCSQHIICSFDLFCLFCFVWCKQCIISLFYLFSLICFVLFDAGFAYSLWIKSFWISVWNNAFISTYSTNIQFWKKYFFRLLFWVNFTFNVFSYRQITKIKRQKKEMWSKNPVTEKLH